MNICINKYAAMINNPMLLHIDFFLAGDLGLSQDL